VAFTEKCPSVPFSKNFVDYSRRTRDNSVGFGGASSSVRPLGRAKWQGAGGVMWLLSCKFAPGASHAAWNRANPFQIRLEVPLILAQLNINSG